MPLLFPLLRSAPRGQSTLGMPALLRGNLPLPAPKLLISGVTRDAAGVILGSCVVSLYRTADDVLVDRVTSDPSTGAYAFGPVGAQLHYVVAYKAGSPDVTGTTVNTLFGAG